MAELSEVDILFELLLPLFLDQRADAMARFGATVHLAVRGDPPRTWTLTGGQKPWLKRGHDGEPDLELVFSPRLVTWVLKDEVPDGADLVAEGDLGVRGDRQVLDRLGATWTQARSLLATLAQRHKPT